MDEPLTAEIAAIHAYQEQHPTCDIQQHPWQAVFGAGFAAGQQAGDARLREAAGAMAQYLYATNNPGALPRDVRQAMALLGI